jgi:hypothetical protein
MAKTVGVTEQKMEGQTLQKLNSLPVLLHLNTPYLYPIIDA